VLAVKNMSKSTGFLRFMGASRLVGRPANRGNRPSLIGGSSEASPADVSKRFEFVQKLGTPDEVTSTDPFKGSNTDVTFTCVPATDPAALRANANTVNIGSKTKSQTEIPTVNLLRFTPTGLSVRRSAAPTEYEFANSHFVCRTPNHSKRLRGNLKPRATLRMPSR
jgi:hypothetical protein